MDDDALLPLLVASPPWLVLALLGYSLAREWVKDRPRRRAARHLRRSRRRL